jgi:cytochrome b561
MQWKSSERRYGAVAMAIHWASAAAILGLLASGFIAANDTDPGTKAAILRIHAAAGILVLLLTLARIAWWALADVRPALPGGTSGFQARAARLVHNLFYVVILAMAASGIAMLALSGAVAILYFGAPGPLPDFETLPPRAAHGFGAWAMLALLALHLGAALFHQLVMRDRLLARIIPSA